MTQLALPGFEPVPVEYARGRPLCFYDPECKGARGRCVLGPAERGEGYENRSLTCETCGCRGTRSTNLTL